MADDAQCWQECGSTKNLIRCGGKKIWYNHFKNYLAVSFEVRHTLTIWPSNYTLRYLCKKNENICPHSGQCLYTTICSGFIQNHQSWKQFKNPSTGKYINKWYTTQQLKRYVLVIHETRMNLKSIMLSERSQTQRVIICMILSIFMWHFGKGKTRGPKIRLMFTWGWGSD